MLSRRHFVAGSALALAVSPAKAQQPQWRIVAQDGAEGTLSGDACRVTSAGKGYVHLRCNLPGQVKRLSFAGRSLPGNVPPILTIAADGTWLQNIFRSTSSYEFELSSKVLDVYLTTTAQTDFALSLGHADCKVCMTADDLRTQILNETPGLQAALDQQRRVDAAVMLLDWCSNNTVWNLSTSLYAQSDDYLSMPAAQLYFEHLRGGSVGYVCGGQTYWMIEVCKLFNLHAMAIHTGYGSSGFTHAFVSIPIEREGGHDFYLMDPSFNAVLTRHGAPTPLGDYFAVGRDGWSFDPRPMPTRRYLMDSRDIGPVAPYMPTRLQGREA